MIAPEFLPSKLTVVGVDPGLVHTGVVHYQVFPMQRTILRRDHVIVGPDQAVEGLRLVAPGAHHIFVEDYIERGKSYGTNSRMRELLQDLRKEIPRATFLNNTGVKKVVRRPLLQVMHLESFRATNHQDLEAAARIMVYGMLKDNELNRVVTHIVQSHLAGNPYTRIN